MSIKKLLPIGSVVQIEDLAPKFMIIGHMQKQANGEQIWDYAAVPYPFGLIDPDKFVLFNHEKVILIHFIGLQDKEGLDYMRALYYQVNNLEPPVNDSGN